MLGVRKETIMSKVSMAQNFNKSNVQFTGIPNQCRKLSPKEKKMLSEYIGTTLLKSSSDCNKLVFLRKYLLPIYKKVANASVKIQKIFIK